LANFATRTQQPTKPHKLETLANTQPLLLLAIACTTVGTTTTEPRNAPRVVYPTPLAVHDVYVDDFISLAQGNTKRRGTVRRQLLHTIDQVFRPLECADSHFWHEPISVKTLGKGDAAWTTQKLVLGGSLTPSK
jgi:hypothetical protein